MRRELIGRTYTPQIRFRRGHDKRLKNLPFITCGFIPYFLKVTSVRMHLLDLDGDYYCYYNFLFALLLYKANPGDRMV
jgi:hypothetical protein